MLPPLFPCGFGKMIACAPVHVNRELFTALYGNVFDEQIDMGELVTVKTNHLQVTCEKG